MHFPEDLRNQIKSHIADRCGLYFRDHDLRNLESGVAQRMKVLGLDSAHAYYLHLTASAEKEDEFRDLLNLLTVNHTYFFRNEPQFAALKEKVFPELLERKRRQAALSKSSGRPVLRIWSAGCSTGEEPYTVAMILREIVPDLEDWQIEILATDASMDALGKAKQGIYGENSMRLVEEPYRGKYFTKTHSSKHAAEWRISDEIKKMVQFGFLNLVADPFPQGLDIILCRNVTIYFELKTTLAIMDRFFEHLTDPGYLFLGYSESLQFLTDKFRMVSWQDAIYYRKAAGQPAEPVPAASLKSEEEEVFEPVEELAPAITNILEAEAERPAALTPEAFEEIRKQIVRLIYLKEYSKALALIDKIAVAENRKVDIHYLAADIYTSMNRHEEAKARLKKALALDPFFAPAYYLLGCIFLEENRHAEAKENFQKALYIDKDFVMARFYMAHMLRGEGRVQDAIREYRNTLAILSQELAGPRSEMVMQGSGFSKVTLKSICRDNLERLKIEQ